jgi:hypothetical protein
VFMGFNFTGFVFALFEFLGGVELVEH